jgi:protein ATS1
MLSRMYAFGSNSAGQLGVGHQDDTAEVQRCQFKRLHDSEEVAAPEVKQIAAGGNHTLLLTGSGQIWAAGSNSDGRCISDIREGSLKSFHQVETFAESHNSFQGVTNIAATWEASIIVLDERWVLTCGTGTKGELGQGHAVTTSAKLTQIWDCTRLSLQTKIAKVVVGLNHAVILTSGGDLFGWGSSRKGQLGEALMGDKVVWTPTKILVPFKVSNIGAGRDFTVLTSTDQTGILLFGDNRHFPDITDFPPENEGAVLQCGWSNIYFHHCPALHAIGRNDRGQLPPRNLPPLRLFAAGSEHCLACTDTDDIVAWGWGEHGNCGVPANNRGNVAGDISVVDLARDPGEGIEYVAAGCATSFVVMSKA